MIELMGYLGSALVVVSMLMASVVKLRIVNTIGSGIFAVYALLIHSYPTALMNVCLVGINLYNLYKLSRKDQSYSLVEAAPEDRLLSYLLDCYREDIRKYFPGFSADCGADRAYLVCCGGTPAGVLLGREEEAGVLRVTALWGPISTASSPPEGSTPWSMPRRNPRPTPPTCPKWASPRRRASTSRIWADFAHTEKLPRDAAVPPQGEFFDRNYSPRIWVAMAK